MISKFMKASGSQPLQYYKLEPAVTESVAIAGSRAHLVVDSSHFILSGQVLVTVSTGKTILMLFINMSGKVVVCQEYKVTAGTLKFLSRVRKNKCFIHGILYSDMIIQILCIFGIELACPVFTFKLNLRGGYQYQRWS